MYVIWTQIFFDYENMLKIGLLFVIFSTWLYLNYLFMYQFI